MKPERWEQLDELFHSARELASAERAAFLDKACVGDDLLRSEVEALLSAHGDARSFIENPALEVEARALANNQPDSVVGQTIGHYKIITSIGTGGMGEVYLAQDMQLGRKVALKLLPAEFTQDNDRVRRFQQEARAASALNHPNIITIHDIGQAEGRHFIATEYIEGETLRQTINVSKSLQLGEVLSIGMQVADALAAAHAKGIVHRDIKPENIILVRDSHLQQRESFVKVLDFGIAKLTEQEAGTEGEATTRVLLNTHEGSVIGTASYMSPEQARGDKVDERTDIWSLGIVLYEMLSSGLPFGGDTAQDVIASILKEEPPALPIEVPDRLRWIVKKTLRKNRDERYQTAREMFSDLRELHNDENELKLRNQHQVSPDWGNSADARVDRIEKRSKLTRDMAKHPTSRAQYFFSEVKRHGSVAILLFTALVICAAGILFGVYKFIGWNQSQTFSENQAGSPMPFQRMKPSRLTSIGKATHAAISPDGKYVVHVVDDGQQQSLWMRQVFTPSNVQINAPADVTYFGLTFSPGGDYLYYNAWDKKTPYSLFQMPVLGGAAKRLVTDIDSVVTFSPDGKQFAFLRGYPSQGELALLVANADGTLERKVAKGEIPTNNSIGDPAWSPDGKVIAYPAESTHSNGKTILEVQVADGSTKSISSQQWWEVEGLVWLRDGSGLVFTARESVASPSQIWFLSYRNGQALRITNDLNDYRGVSLTADSAVLCTVKSEQVSNIWIVPNNDTNRAGQITNSKLDGVAGISWTPDGKIVYTSEVSGKLDLWIMEANGTGQRQLTAEAGNNRHPSVSPDGRYVVFISDRTGINHVWRIDIDGSNAKQLTNAEGEWDPKCSPSGWVFYQSGSGRASLWKVSIDGGDAIQVIDKTSAGIAISPDGKWIASAHFEPTAIKTAVYPSEGGELHKILDINAIYIRWTPDSRALAYLDVNSSNINRRSIDDGPLKPLTNFTSDRIFSFAWSQDGRQLALSRGTLNHDVVVIRDFKD